MAKSTGPLYALGGAHPHALERNDAMRGLATGNRDGKTAKREQQIHTPDCVIEVCRKVWPEGIALDPCASSEQLIDDAAEHFLNFGLAFRWRDRTYVNPPYADLSDWLAKSRRELFRGAREQILLFPARPNRVWWCDYMRQPDLVVAWLKPLKFVGFAGAFPAPLVLVYTGGRPASFLAAVEPLACHVSPGLGDFL